VSEARNLFAAFAIDDAERSEAIVTPAYHAAQHTGTRSTRSKVADFIIVIL
jgi:hypothetical protein